jgi:hypothetical protein
MRGSIVDARRHLQDSLTEMQAVALTRGWHELPACGLAELAGVGVFDPLGQMRVRHGESPQNTVSYRHHSLIAATPM